jgi:dynein heavy chain, axonemal
MTLTPPSKQLNKPCWEAVCLHSPDGESLDLSEKPLVIDGPVELWLVQLEAAMQGALARQLQACVAAYRTSKKDKWVKEYQGQLLITTGAIQV